MSADFAVVTEGLSKVFKTGLLGRRIVQALNGVSLSLTPGATHAILGPNGSGKTTLIKLLMGLLVPTGGSARLLGLPSGCAEALSRTGFLPETPGLLPNLTGKECVLTAARMRGMPRQGRAARCGELLERFGLADCAGRRVGQYSLGMKKRVALCLALVHDPELLILDEPASGLDPASSSLMERIVRERASSGRTVVLSSHLLGRVEAMADTVHILDAGSVACSGTLAEVSGIPGAFDMRVRGDDPESARAALKAAGFAVESVRNARDPLEEVYLRVTRGEKPPAVTS